ncbi:MAG: hypothetical protein COA97_09925 [Flavobacteriales bacterium]|nr:MAG: hypothetical protein COA97_09925 [Flavobacteriales bacterium]
MNRIILLLSLLFFTVSANAQNWFPFPLGQKSFYQYNNITTYPSDTTINIYYADSIVNFGTHQILHFDYTTLGYNGCYEAVNNSSSIYQTSYFDKIRPDSIIVLADSLIFAFNYDIWGIQTDSILFLPKTPKDSSWFSAFNNINLPYDSLKFTCDSIYLDTIVGNITDSIKLISIQAYNNSLPISSVFDTLKILLSKNYGLKQWVSFYTVLKEIPLIGLDSGITQEGFQLPQFLDYFHLSVGDIIIWKQYDYTDDIQQPNTTIYYKDSITSVISTPDSVIYNYKRNYSTGSQFNGIDKYYQNKLQALNFSTSIYCPSSIIRSINLGIPDNHLLESSGIYQTNDSILNRIYSPNGVFYDTSSCTPYQMVDFSGSFYYNTYYGLSEYHSVDCCGYTDWTIEGSIINGIQIGNIINVGVGELKNKQTFNIYPNPNNQEFITIEGKNIIKTELLNIQGQQLLSSTETKISTIYIPKGIYLVKVTFKNGEIATQKLILTR